MLHRVLSNGPQVLLLVMLFALTPPPLFADVRSGPETDKDVPALEVFGIVGKVTEESVDYVKTREDRPTVYFFVDSDKWSRPIARLMRKLDTDLAANVNDVYQVAIWLTDDTVAAKEYLNRVNISLKMEQTALTVYEGDKTGPPDWSINDQADCTVVVVHEGKVVATFGFVSANDTDADQVLETLDEAVKP